MKYNVIDDAVWLIISFNEYIVTSDDWHLIKSIIIHIFTFFYFRQKWLFHDRQNNYKYSDFYIIILFDSKIKKVNDW